MKTDRELTEMAAKGVGLPECGWMGDTFTYVKDNRFTSWEPLSNDSDALRLAVKLNIGVVQYAGIGPGFVRAGENIGYLITEPYNLDPYAATRRAVVRAAAKLGRAGYKMPTETDCGASKMNRIATSPLTGRIHSGRVNATGDRFIGEKKDVTSDVLCAVIEKAAFHGGTFDVVGGGKQFFITVSEMPQK